MRELGFGGCFAVIKGGHRPGSSTSEDGVGALSAFSFLRAMKPDIRLFILACDEARRTLAFGAAQCIAITSEIELLVILKARESLNYLHRHGIWLALG